jgi:hypothetical protein
MLRAPTALITAPSQNTRFFFTAAFMKITNGYPARVETHSFFCTITVTPRVEQWTRALVEDQIRATRPEFLQAPWKLAVATLIELTPSQFTSVSNSTADRYEVPFDGGHVGVFPLSQ